MGTDAGLWFADRIDGVAVGDGTAGAIYQRLRHTFDKMITDLKQ
jgi:hypothetical protein